MNQMNNPLFQVVSAMQRGANPMAMLQQMAQQDPRAAQAMRMVQGKNAQQLQQMAENMAKERGTTTADVARSLGIQLPGGR